MSPSFGLEFSGRTTLALYDPIKEELIRGISNLQGLTNWSAIGMKIRDALFSGRQLVIFTADGAIDSTKLINYFLPAIILGGIFLFFALATLIGGPIACCCYARSQGKKSKKPIYYPRSAFFFIAIVLFVMSSLLIAGVLIGYFSNQALTAGIESMRNNTGLLLSDASSTLQRAPSALDSMFVAASSFVNETVAGIASVANITGLVANLTSPKNTAISHLTSLNSSIVDMQAVASLLKSNATFAINNGTDLINGLYALTVSADDLNDPKTLSEFSTTYQLIVPIDVTSYQTQLSSSNATNTVDLSPITTLITDLASIPDLNALSSTFQSVFGSINSTANTQIASITDGTKSTLNEQITALRSTLLPEVLRVLQPIENDVIPLVQSQFNSLSAEVLKYSNIRAAVIYAILSLSLIFAIVGLLAAYTPLNKKITPKAAGLSMVTMFFFWLLGALLFILAVLLGTGCNIVFRDKLAPIATQMNINTTLSDGIFNSIDSCANDGDIFEIVNNLGFFQIPNITNIVQQEIDKLNVTTLFSSFNSSSLFDFASFSAQQSQFESYNLTSFDFSSLSKQSLLNDLKGNMTSLKTTLSSLKTSVNSTFFTFTPSTGNTTITDACVTQFKADIDSIITGIDNLNSTKVSTIQGLLDGMLSKGNQFVTNANSTMGVFNNLVSTFNSVIAIIESFVGDLKHQIEHSTLPSLETSVISFVNTSLSILKSTINCKALAKDVLAIENSICTAFLGGLDTVWWTFVWCGFFSFFFIVSAFSCVRIFSRRKRVVGASNMKQTKSTQLSHIKTGSIASSAAMNSP